MHRFEDQPTRPQSPSDQVTTHIITVTPATARLEQSTNPLESELSMAFNNVDSDSDDNVAVYSAALGDRRDLRPKAYIFPILHESASAQSTPSDCRSICESPDSDPWAIPELTPTGPQWDDLSTYGKVHRIGLNSLKVVSLFGLLYFFICSLDLLSTAFRLLGTRAVGRFFNDSELLQNPVVGLMIGVLVTVLVQSSSTSTSIVVTMVASHIIKVRQAIPIVMGANIGTSVTNTIVSLMQSADRNQFRRAFAAATVHDVFNWLTVMVLLPIEVSTHYLERLTGMLVNNGQLNQDKTANRQFLNALTKPFTKMIIKVDKKLLELIASGNETDPSAQLVIRCCKGSGENQTCASKCSESFFGWMGWSDSFSGTVLLVISLVVLCSCLLMLVKILNSMLTGPIARIIKSTMNRDYNFPYSVLADYLAILAGCLLTILVQSSSIFTSAMTPLAGIGVISLERMYPLTLGSNIGTTTTGILAALAADPSRIHDTLQLALCHLFFNLSGIAIFYPIPFMRFPIPLSRMLGNITANYRWFSVMYLVCMFFIFPLLVFALSTLGIVMMLSTCGLLAALLLLVVIINLIQKHRSAWLPFWLQNWNFLPLWLHSLDPMDRVITKISEKLGCVKCCGTSSALQHHVRRGHDGPKLGHHESTHHSQLHILGSLYKSNSESQFQNLIYDQDQEKLKKSGTKGVVYQLAKNNHRLGANLTSDYYHHNNNNNNNNLQPLLQSQQPQQTIDLEPGKGSDPFEAIGHLNWDRYNSHTVHSPYEVHRYYPPSPFMVKSSNNHNTNSTTNDATESTVAPSANNTLL